LAAFITLSVAPDAMFSALSNIPDAWPLAPFNVDIAPFFISVPEFLDFDNKSSSILVSDDA
jgi:hypothetical protein